jgi:peptidoglycan/LPS O-acetylase OafA/YrhL
MLVITTFIIIDIISTSVIVSKNNYDHGILSDFYINRSNTSHNYMNDVYTKPWCRIIPYAIGLALGHALYELYQRSNTLSWESILPRRRSARFNRLNQIIAWIFALLILSLCVFGTYGDYNNRPLTRSGRITFLVLSRLGWSIGLSIIILTCFFGQGGVVNKLLSHRFFRALSKLTYGAYLWHSLVIFVNYLSRDQPAHYTIANIVCWIFYSNTKIIFFCCFSSSIQLFI